MSQFIIDSGAFLAMLDARDKYHTQAQTFIAINREATFFIPDAIFAETMTLVKSRLGAKSAVSLGERIFISSLFQIVVLPEEQKPAIWSIFKQYDDKHWSYADCAILATARYLQVTAVFSFDHHIEQMIELTRVPSN
jgi:predicted nucleic acid-binding protein